MILFSSKTNRAWWNYIVKQNFSSMNCSGDNGVRLNCILPYKIFMKETESMVKLLWIAKKLTKHSVWNVSQVYRIKWRAQNVRKWEPQAAVNSISPVQDTKFNLTVVICSIDRKNILAALRFLTNQRRMIFMRARDLLTLLNLARTKKGSTKNFYRTLLVFHFYLCCPDWLLGARWLCITGLLRPTIPCLPLIW